MTARNLVLFSLEPWDDIWRRNQYLVDGLLRRDAQLHVLFVEPPHDVVHAASRRAGLTRGRGLRRSVGYEARLSLLQPTKWLPRLAGPFANLLLRGEVDRAVRALEMHAPAVWINDPGWAHHVTARGPRTLYDVTDDWTAANRPAREHRRVVADDRKLTDEAVEVVVCSAGLEATMAARGRRVRLIPNAVELERYRRPLGRPDDMPRGRTAVYVGTLHEDRLDVQLAIDTAAALRDAGSSLVFVGPDALASENGQALREAGAHILGPRPYDTVPAYLQHGDVLIVPHIVDPFTDSLDPIKLYEYLAVGRPVVSTPVAGFRDLHGPGIEVADRARFAETVRRTASVDEPTRVRSGIPDWADRVDAMADAVDGLFDVPGPSRAR